MPPASEDPTSAAADSAPLAPAAAASDVPTAENPGGAPGEAAPGAVPENAPRRRRRRRRKPASAGMTAGPATEPAGEGEAAVAAEAPPAASADAPGQAARPRHRRRRHRPRPLHAQGRLLTIAEAGLGGEAVPAEGAPGEATPEGASAAPASAETARPRLTLRLRRPREPRPLGSAVRAPDTQASAAPAGETPSGPPRRPRRRRRQPVPADAASAAPPTGRSPRRADPAPQGERGPRERDRAGRRGERRRGAPDRMRGDGRGRPRPEPERRLYALEAIVDRGFEDVEEEGETRRIPWTIVKRAVADQKSGKQMSAVYVLRRDGADQEFPNLGAARGAAHKTIVHPEKLTLSKAEHAAARGAGDGKKAR